MTTRLELNTGDTAHYKENTLLLFIIEYKIDHVEHLPFPEGVFLSLVNLNKKATRTESAKCKTGFYFRF